MGDLKHFGIIPLANLGGIFPYGGMRQLAHKLKKSLHLPCPLVLGWGIWIAINKVIFNDKKPSHIKAYYKIKYVDVATPKKKQ